jgi:gluconate kinase
MLTWRLKARRGHFAGPALLASQLVTLETPAEGLELDARLSPACLVEQIAGAVLRDSTAAAAPKATQRPRSH